MKIRLVLIIACLCLIPFAALAEATPADLPATATDVPVMAEDITDQVTFKAAGDLRLLRDGSYGRIWDSGLIRGICQLTIAAPEGKTIGGVVIHWRAFPLAVTMQKPDGNGGWVDIASYEGKHYEQYYPVDGLDEIRIIHRDHPKENLRILEVTVVTPGELPEHVHVWQDPAEKVDLMLLHGHPDDELLWFGGLLPYYGGELQKEVLVVCAAPSHYQRRHELLDALWTCGIRKHPVFLPLSDVITHNMNTVLDKWGRSTAESLVTELYRRYKPDVVVTHDILGEYGHGVHKAISYIARNALTSAADETKYPQQVEQYGVWNVPKAYVHLYEENQIQMDWWQSLSAFQGRTAQDVAREAFLCHKSQQERAWAVQDHGEDDNSLFGLYHTTVGPDVIGDDMFENIPN